jgi:hypothetical protein
VRDDRGGQVGSQLIEVTTEGDNLADQAAAG